MLARYLVPSWAVRLRHVPNRYVKLVQRLTPIEQWRLAGVPSEFKVSIKRDDLTGFTLSGNKVRKLEFILAEVLDKGYNSVVACGGLQSNFCRTVSLACSQIGLDCHLILRCPKHTQPSDVKWHGNLLLCKLSGAKISLVEPVANDGEQFEVENRQSLMTKLDNYTANLRSMGRNPYSIPQGGSTLTGMWGQIETFNELITQKATEHFNDLWCVYGSGGMAAGLSIANYLTGSKMRVHAVLVSKTPVEEAYHRIDKRLEESGLENEVRAADIINIVDGYEGTGFSSFYEEDLEKLLTVAATTGIVLDYAYNLKAVTALTHELTNNPARFKGNNILYMHSGGIFGLFDEKFDNVMRKHPLTKSIPVL